MDAASNKFQIFRADGAPSLEASKIMSIVPFTQAQKDGLAKMNAANPHQGSSSTVLFNIPGFSLVHAWFKKDYPLVLHSHDSDCLYYVIAGSIKVGTEWLGPRDGFFVPGGVPYTHTPGPEGAEVLEFRHTTNFDFKMFSKNDAFFDRAANQAAAQLDEWATAQPPGPKPLAPGKAAETSAH